LPALALAALVAACVRMPSHLLSEAAHSDQAFAMITKRPQNAYMHFASEKRAEYTEEGMKVGEVAKALGEAWRSLSPAKQKPYQKMAMEDKARFEEDLKQGMVPKERKTKKASKPKKEGPKKASTAYIFFVKDQRAKVAKEGQSPPEVMKALGAKWQSMTARTKKKYEMMAAEDKERYQKEFEAMGA